jgi:hypothetical protein
MEAVEVAGPELGEDTALRATEFFVHPGSGIGGGGIVEEG